MRGVAGSWDSHHLADIDILVSNGFWFMYYVGVRYREERVKESCIGLAVSNNGVVWKKYPKNPIVKPSLNYWWEKGTHDRIGVETPTVFQYKRKYYMIYSSIGYDRKYYLNAATSNNGVTWKKYEGNPILRPEKHYEGTHIDHPKVVKVNDILLMFYLGLRNKLESVLNVAFAKADEPFSWERYSKNPILVANKKLRTNPPFIIKLLLKLGLSVEKIRSLKKLLKKTSFIKQCYEGKLWDTWFIYRATPLVDNKRNIVFLKDKITLLYYSAYNYFSGLPSIGLTILDLSEVLYEARR
ncbi:MAG: hypothetical protein B6U76_02405 [Desulfurococcales archaeon ex4484_217_2]|nr:MAG: hypothetical protein B6U76_02405 [Desulfurococcales archaeon ex4484_217_2]